jgi:hypothetical protein
MTGIPPNNLLTALHRWSSRQDENFVTDSFAHALRRLLEFDPMVGLEILRRLTDYRLNVTQQSEAQSIAVTTQVTTELGTPDIEIRACDHLAYIESKVEAELGDRQLERYLEMLEKDSDVSSRTLVLLSRYPVELDQGLSERVVQRRWYQVADWLHAALRSHSILDPINVFLVEQFIGFLQSRNITMEKVGWDLPGGVKSLRSLALMLGEAIAAVKFAKEKSVAWDYVGFSVLEKDKLSGKPIKPFFLGIYYEHPEVIVFETNQASVGDDAIERVGFGKLVIDRDKQSGKKWVNELLLDSEDVHFFALSRERQMQRVEEFLRHSLAAANRIRGSEQL